MKKALSFLVVFALLQYSSGQRTFCDPGEAAIIICALIYVPLIIPCNVLYTIDGS